MQTILLTLDEANRANAWELGSPVIDWFVKANLVTSKSAARKLIEQKGARVNDELITNIHARIFLTSDNVCVIMQ